MKKLLCILFVASLCACLTACGVSESDTTGSAQVGTENGVDTDLTQLSSNMVYAEVNHMMTVPDSYVGKTVKVKGQYSCETSEISAYHFVVVSDALACCQQGMEFVLGNTAKDYPAQGTEITVIGEFQLYQEGEGVYCHLENATIDY